MNKGMAAKALLENAIAGLLGAGTVGAVGHFGAKAYNTIAPDDWDLDVGDATRFAAINGALGGVLGRSMYGMASKLGGQGIQDVMVRGRSV
jgi:hypothetical protein